ncbi:anti-sigma factor domain-containing protein [Sinomicrobium weinanense]|uniref:Anti-sigma factor n=1 Tax=Sinomicrobium weinanense TaxID=2842200 RepID=A0A926JRQ7_9FLAO|nr:anti-sigma factor [Sinomicrobium weinanense]MBC9796094.1 anti-sigma factor [Sinomicrobium weinanense]MBU3124763.1 anti-sigma factor [Sinomicrobium weinanense]
MNHDIKTMLESDLLERYLIGSTSSKENYKIEEYIARYPEVKQKYTELQEDLESYTMSFSRPAPDQVKKNVMKTIRKEKKRSTPWYYNAAAVIAVIFCTSTILLLYQNKQLLYKNGLVNEEIAALKSDILNTNSKLDDVKNQFLILNNPKTQKYILKGNRRAKNLKTVAYIDPVEKLSMVNIVSLPELPKEQVFQMWAEIDGKMVSLGVLENAQNKLLSIPFKEGAKSYNITIEPKGGNINATEENMVASIYLR